MEILRRKIYILNKICRENVQKICNPGKILKNFLDETSSIFGKILQKISRNIEKFLKNFE